MDTNKNIVIKTAAERNWGWLLALGVLFVIMGTIGLGMVVGLTVVSMLFLGAILLIAGFTQIVDVFRSHRWKAAFTHALIAVLYLVAGGLVLYDPLLASALITMLLAGILIVIGLSRMLMSFQIKAAKGWGWLFLAGLLSIMLGFMILIQWPISGLWVIGLFIAIQILIDGWAFIFLALSARSKKHL